MWIGNENNCIDRLGVDRTICSCKYRWAAQWGQQPISKCRSFGRKSWNPVSLYLRELATRWNVAFLGHKWLVLPNPAKQPPNSLQNLLSVTYPTWPRWYYTQYRYLRLNEFFGLIYIRKRDRRFSGNQLTEVQDARGKLTCSRCDNWSSDPISRFNVSSANSNFLLCLSWTCYTIFSFAIRFLPWCTYLFNRVFGDISCYRHDILLR